MSAWERETQDMEENRQQESKYEEERKFYIESDGTKMHITNERILRVFPDGSSFALFRDGTIHIRRAVGSFVHISAGGKRTVVPYER